MGRHQGQAPSIDGQVYLTGTEYLERQPAPGDMVRVRVGMRMPRGHGGLRGLRNKTVGRDDQMPRNEQPLNDETKADQHSEESSHRVSSG